MSAEGTLVVIPTYDRAAWLAEAIESVLSQDYPALQVIVVDDGSTDDIPAVCDMARKRYPDREVPYIRQDNRGCASARNRGLACRSGRDGYVAFLDSDDRFLPGKLRREVALLRAHPEADFVYSDAVRYDEATGCESRRPVAAAGRPDRFAIEHFLTSEAKSCAILYRARVFDTLQFRETMRYDEDTEFLQRVALEYGGVYCPEPGAWYRDHAGGKSHDRLAMRQAEWEVCCAIRRDYSAFSATFARDVERRTHQLRRGLLRELVQCGQWEAAAALAVDWQEHLLVRSRSRWWYRFRDMARMPWVRSDGDP